jgi:hypothetical protein
LKIAGIKENRASSPGEGITPIDLTNPRLVYLVALGKINSRE